MSCKHYKKLTYIFKNLHAIALVGGFGAIGSALVFFPVAFVIGETSNLSFTTDSIVYFIVFSLLSLLYGLVGMYDEMKYKQDLDER